MTHLLMHALHRNVKGVFVCLRMHFASSVSSQAPGSSNDKPDKNKKKKKKKKDLPGESAI